MKALLIFLLASSPAWASPLSLTIATKGNELLFDKKELHAKAGQKVKLTFKNTGNMQHDFVLVKPGSADAVANAAIAAGFGANWFVKTPDVLANTKLLDAKKSETIEFTAPSEPGDYPYICTYPGHAATMKGVLKITK